MNYKVDYKSFSNYIANYCYNTFPTVYKMSQSICLLNVKLGWVLRCGQR